MQRRRRQLRWAPELAPCRGAVAFDPIIMELAALAHRLWCDRMRADGWRYGPQYDEAQKTHDAMVPFDELSAHDRRAACLGIRHEAIASRTADAIEYTRGPEREFSPEEIRAGIPVTWARWIVRADGPELTGEEHGTIVSWEFDVQTGGLALIRVRWDDGQVSEHCPSERDLRRLSEPP